MTSASAAISRSLISVPAGLLNMRLKITGIGLYVPPRVETAAQLAFLTEQRCDFIQGYLIGRPTDAASTTGWLKQVQSQGCIWAP